MNLVAPKTEQVCVGFSAVSAAVTRVSRSLVVSAGATTNVVVNASRRDVGSSSFPAAASSPLKEFMGGTNSVSSNPAEKDLQPLIAVTFAGSRTNDRVKLTTRASVNKRLQQRRNHRRRTGSPAKLLDAPVGGLTNSTMSPIAVSEPPRGREDDDHREGPRMSSADEGERCLRRSQLHLLIKSQLDLIKKQSEALLFKDNQLRELRMENNSLLQQLQAQEQQRQSQLGRRPKPKQASKATQKSSRSSSSISRRDKSVETTPDLLEGLKVCRKSGELTAAEGVLASSGEDTSRTLLTSPRPYFCLRGEAFVAEEKREIKGILCKSDVPEYRECGPLPAAPALPFQPNAIGGGDGMPEDDGDSSYEQRHAKLEADEKRRKRWDLQRLRQQRYYERLKARYDNAGNSAGSTTSNHPHVRLYNSSRGEAAVHQGELLLPPPPSAQPNHKNAQNVAEDVASLSQSQLRTPWNHQDSLYQCPDLATHISVEESVPISAFGFNLVKIERARFALPWFDCHGSPRTEVSSKRGVVPTKSTKGSSPVGKRKRATVGVDVKAEDPPRQSKAAKGLEGRTTAVKRIKSCPLSAD